MENARPISRDDFLKLSKLGRVGIAARCARRALQRAVLLTEQDHQILCQAIDLADLTASSGVYADADVVEKIEASALEIADSASRCIDETGAFAARAAANAAVTASINNSMVALAVIADCMRVYIDEPTLVAAIRYDCNFLSLSQRESGWNESAVIELGFFGPLWPAMQLKCMSQQKQYLLLEFEYGEQDSAVDIQEKLLEVIKRAGALYLAHGGSGFIVDDLQLFTTERSTIEVQ